MTRIIQRCFLVLAFTGILLSQAQEEAVSDVSDPALKSSEQPSPSTPEVISTTPVGTAAPKDNVESNSHAEAATGTSQPEVTADDVTKTYSQSSSSSISKDLNDGAHSVETTTGLSLEHSEGLFKAPLHDDEPNDGEKLTNSSEKSSEEKSTKGPSAKAENDSNVKIETTSGVTDAATATISVVAGTSESTKAAEMTSIENSSKDSEWNSVPSNEELISNSSDVDGNQTEEMFSTAPSEVQTEESAKSATRKRSLNGTHTIAGETTGVPTSSSTDASSHTVLPSVTTEVKYVENVTGNDEEPSPEDNLTKGHTDEIETNKTVSLTHDTEVTHSPYTISYINIVGAHSTGNEHSMSDISISPLQDTHLLPISSAALSSVSEESIHPPGSIDTIAQTPSVRHDISTPSTPGRSPELELEDSVPDSSFNTLLPVTFDPNGMTHNFSQDPDSVTFSPEVFHVDGMPTDGFLARLENGDAADQRPALSPDSTKFMEGTTHAFEAHGTDMEVIHSSEREREGISLSTQGLLPHDEPDVEEMPTRNIVKNTAQPTINPFITGEPLTPENTKVIKPLNDESEEMLNDSPHFIEAQSKPTTPPVKDIKNEFITKDLEMHVSNDISSHTTGASSKVTHELDFSIDYQKQQSEIRPVTVTSPFKTSESPTDSFNLGSQSPPEVTKSDTVLPDASSPSIILPNPAPSVVNQNTEAVTVMSQPGVLPDATSGENPSSGSPNSTIAGVAVKTSVSVSLPLSKTENRSANSTAEETMDDASILPNISGVILPAPILLNKDADGHPAPTIVSTEAPAEATTESRGGLRNLRPKLRGGDSGESEGPRTRKPFLRPPEKASTTAGPPVSIFKKAKTRVASITSSTTARPFPQFSTIRIHYASRIPGMVPNGELVFSTEPVTTTEATTTETEEPFSDEPFTDPTQGPIVPNEDDVTLIKVAGAIVVDKGLRWNDQLINRHSPQYKEKANYVQMQLDRLFRTSPVASQLWKIQIDGFSGKRKSRSVVVDFFMYLIKTQNEISTDQLKAVFHEKLNNNTFSRFTVDPAKTTFEILNEEPMRPPTEAPEREPEPVIPQWAIAVIVVGAASLIFIVLFAVVAILGRHHMRRRYSNKLNDEDSDRPSDWESKMAAAYENLAADTIYDAEDLHSDNTYKKSYLVD